MKALKLETHTHNLKIVRNTPQYLDLLSYASVQEYNRSEYYYKLYPLHNLSPIEGEKNIEELIKEPPTEIAYSVDGSYLKICWEKGQVLSGKFPSCGVKSHVFPRK